MILFILGAGFVSLALIVSALAALSDVSALDRTPLGPWGVVEREPSVRRPLTAHERRWQTAMTRGQSESVHWETLLASLDELGAAAGATPFGQTEIGTGTAHAEPAELDRRYLTARINHLETHLADRQRDNE